MSKPGSESAAPNAYRSERTRGAFITLEGGEGAGKSTQIRLLADALRAHGHRVIETREPGGSPGAEAIRHVLLSGAAESLGAEGEAMLFAAARADHVATLIAPALEAGKTVLCDRFIDSTRVYQGERASMDLIRALEDVSCGRCRPDLTLILDVPPDLGAKRLAERHAAGEGPDRFEKDAADEQARRREAFLAIARAEPERCRVVDASGAVETIHHALLAECEALFQRLRDGGASA